MKPEIFLNFLTLSLVNPLFAAMSLVDSSAAFERKCRDLKGGDELFEGLSALGIGDFTTLAFSLGTPQKPPTDDQFDTLGSKVFTNPTLGQLALLRRVHFEATTLMVASINEQVKSDSSDPTSLTKRLPAAERQVHLDLQEKRLAGLVDRTPVTRCREMYGNADLFHHLADNGIRTWDMLNSSFHHVITPHDFVDATEDVFLTERTTVQQRLAVQLIVEEGRRMEGTWGAPPPLKRPRTRCEQTSFQAGLCHMTRRAPCHPCERGIVAVTSTIQLGHTSGFSQFHFSAVNFVLGIFTGWILCFSWLLHGSFSRLMWD